MAAQQKRAYSTTPTTNDPNHEISVVTNANSISSDLYNNYINNNSSNSLNNNQLMNSSNQTNNEILAINQQQMHQHRQQQLLLPQPQQPLQQLITTMLKKTSRGLGFTIRGLEDEDGGGVWLVIKSILPAGPAEMDGKLQRGDVLVSVNDHDVCGLTHFDVVNMFRQLEINQEVKIEVIRGHHSTLNFDLYDGEVNDPSVEVLTTVAVGNADGDDSESSYYSEDVGNARVVYDYHKCMTYNNGSIFSGGPQDIGGVCPYYEYQGLVGVKKIELIIVKGPTGFGFTLADRPEGQKVKQLVDMNRCRGLSEDDLLLEINNQSIRNFSHLEVVQMLKLCPTNQPALFLVERKVLQSKCLNVNDVNSSSISSLQLCTLNGGSCMPNSPYYFRPYSAGSQMQHQQHFLTNSKQLMKHQEHNLYLPLQKEYESNNRSFKQSPCMVHEHLRKQLSSPSSASTLIIDSLTYPQQTPDFIPANVFTSSSTSSESKLTANESGYVGSVSSTSKPQTYRYCSAVEPHNLHHCFNEFCSSCYADNLYLDSINNNNNIVNANINAGANNNMVIKTVFLKKSPTGFGFRVVGGKEEGSQATIGHIVPGGPAYLDGNLCVGQEIVLIDGLNVEGAWHKDVVDLINMAAQKGEVMLSVRDPTDFLNNNQMESMHLSQQLHDVVLTRNENEGFGFYILSSAIKSSPVIGQIVENSPASRAANLKIGSQIIAINNNLILNNMSHNQIVDIIKSSGTSIKLTLTDATPSAPSIDRMIMQATEFKNEGTADSEVAIIDIDLHRSNKGFGFSIRGGQEFNLMPLYVLKIADDGAAKLDGRLQVGDEILKINDAMTQGMTHRDAINIVQSTQAVLHLTIRRFANLSEADDL
ncbi:hypothetical protein HELRODRAFT_188365 [Helobdella robusta]|uniref:PDZ domain-containing protein n=1 Tax=Helobdella robusta TaxID=6412 RepID=T1FPX4_HELRO|nr:hypothetical protein HELRODRAFT_188365 [Helobdella robusta]ESO06466.1 hypothetical protein HELRODRAFT_188365 [Helobdella robusta]